MYMAINEASKPCMCDGAYDICHGVIEIRLAPGERQPKEMLWNASLIS